MGGLGSNPSELERFRSKPSEPSPSLQGSGVPHSDAEARIEMGKSGKTLLSWDLTSNLIAQGNCCFANTSSEMKRKERDKEGVGKRRRYEEL